MSHDFQAIAQKVISKIEKKGSYAAEVFLVDSQEMTIQVARQHVENMKIAQERGLGLRVIVEQKMGYAYTSDLSPRALDEVIAKALHNGLQSIADENWQLPGAYEKYPELTMYDEKIFSTPVEEKISLAKKIEEAARSYDPRVAITERSVYQDSCYQVSVYNTLGLCASYQGAYCGGYALVVGQEGQENQTGFGLQYELNYEKLNPQKIGEDAAQKAVRMLGAKTIPSAKLPVVLDPYIVTNFLGVLQTPLSGEAILKGKSIFLEKEEQMVASPLVSIIDDGTMAGGLGSAPCDGEGVPTSRTVLIQEGRLLGFLHNSYTAKRGGKASTGNGVRSSYKTTPEVGTTNFYLGKGLLSPQNLMADIKKGLYITEVMGMHTANPISGDFSVGASGLLIENGQLTSPVRGIAIAGNLKELLFDIEGVADDLQFFVSKGAPTLRLKSMSISGS